MRLHLDMRRALTLSDIKFQEKPKTNLRESWMICPLETLLITGVYKRDHPRDESVNDRSRPWRA